MPNVRTPAAARRRTASTARALPALALLAVYFGAGGGLRAAARSMPSAERRERVRIAAVLARMPVYPGARAADAAGFPLAVPPQMPASTDLLAVRSLWTVPADATTFGAWAVKLAGRLDMVQAGATSTDASLTSLLFAQRSGPDPLTVEISRQAISRGRLAVRYDVLGIWQPPHGTAETVPVATVEEANVALDSALGRGRRGLPFWDRPCCAWPV